MFAGCPDSPHQRDGCSNNAVHGHGSPFQFHPHEIVFRRELEEATDKKARRDELIRDYRETFSTPYVAAGRRLVDDIIEPADTRRGPVPVLCRLKTNRKSAAVRSTGSWCASKRSRQKIEPGDTLVVLEAMKMETNITAPGPGAVARVLVKPGDGVKSGQLLVEFE